MDPHLKNIKVCIFGSLWGVIDEFPAQRASNALWWRHYVTWFSFNRHAPGCERKQLDGDFHQRLLGLARQRSVGGCVMQSDFNIIYMLYDTSAHDWHWDIQHPNEFITKLEKRRVPIFFFKPCHKSKYHQNVIIVSNRPFFLYTICMLPWKINWQ